MNSSPSPESLKKAREVTIKHWPVSHTDIYEAHVREVALALDEAKQEVALLALDLQKKGLAFQREIIRTGVIPEPPWLEMNGTGDHVQHNWALFEDSYSAD